MGFIQDGSLAMNNKVNNKIVRIIRNYHGTQN